MTINAVNTAGLLRIQLCTPEGRSHNPCPCHTFTPRGSLLRTVVEFTLHHRLNLILTLTRGKPRGFWGVRLLRIVHVPLQ